LLCDEPLLSLDMHHQKVVAALLHEQRVKRDAAVVFVTHEINPILPYVDRILYIVGGHFLVGTPAEVMTTESLSRLYGSPVEVVRVGGRLVVVGGEEGWGDHQQLEHEREPESAVGRCARQRSSPTSSPSKTMGNWSHCWPIRSSPRQFWESSGASSASSSWLGTSPSPSTASPNSPSPGPHSPCSSASTSWPGRSSARSWRR